MNSGGDHDSTAHKFEFIRDKIISNIRGTESSGSRRWLNKLNYLYKYNIGFYFEF